MMIPRERANEMVRFKWSCAFGIRYRSPYLVRRMISLERNSRAILGRGTGRRWGSRTGWVENTLQAVSQYAIVRLERRGEARRVRMELTVKAPEATKLNPSKTHPRDGWSLVSSASRSNSSSSGDSAALSSPSSSSLEYSGPALAFLLLLFLKVSVEESRAPSFPIGPSPCITEMSCAVAVPLGKTSFSLMI